MYIGTKIFHHFQLPCKYQEFVQYQLLNPEDNPLAEALVVNNDEEEHRHYHTDVMWHHIATIKSADDRLKFKILSKIAKLV